MKNQRVILVAEENNLPFVIAPMFFGSQGQLRTITFFHKIFPGLRPDVPLPWQSSARVAQLLVNHLEDGRGTVTYLGQGDSRGTGAPYRQWNFFHAHLTQAGLERVPPKKKLWLTDRDGRPHVESRLLFRAYELIAQKAIAA